MANILYKRHDCIFKDSTISTPIFKTKSNPQIIQKYPQPLRRGVVKKQVSATVKKVQIRPTNTEKAQNLLYLNRRQSISLTNLNFNQDILEMAAPNSSNSTKKKIGIEANYTDLEPLMKDQGDLARQVYIKFIQNAWRHRRLENEKTKNDLKQAETCMANLNIQIIVLRNLLESEKHRVSKYMNEAVHYRVMLEDETRQKNKLKTERDEHEKTINILEKNIQDEKNEYLNVRNELLTCKSEQSALEEQMDREREKLGKYKEDKKLLLEKLKLAEDGNSTKQGLISKLESELQELNQLLLVEREANVNSNTLVNKSLDKLDFLEESKSYLSKEVSILKGTNSQLVEKIKQLEVLLNKKDKENITLTKTCQEQMLEMSHLRTSLTQQKTKSWTSRLPHLASILVHIPISLLLDTLNSPLSITQNF